MTKVHQMQTIEAPWSPDQVEFLRSVQANPIFHGYTCPGGPDCKDKAHRLLVPTPDGWTCVCGAYHQTWAHFP